MDEENRLFELKSPETRILGSEQAQIGDGHLRQGGHQLPRQAGLGDFCITPQFDLPVAYRYETIRHLFSNECETKFIEDRNLADYSLEEVYTEELKPNKTRLLKTIKNNSEINRHSLIDVIKIEENYTKLNRSYEPEERNEIDVEAMQYDVAQLRAEAKIVAEEEADATEYVHARDAEAMQLALKQAFADFYPRQREYISTRVFIAEVALRLFGITYDVFSSSAQVTVADPKLKWMLAHNEHVLADGRPDDAWVAVEVRRKPTDAEVQAELLRLRVLFPIENLKAPVYPATFEAPSFLTSW